MTDFIVTGNRSLQRDILEEALPFGGRSMNSIYIKMESGKTKRFDTKMYRKNLDQFSKIIDKEAPHVNTLKEELA
jgi:hypothetical protein